MPDVNVLLDAWRPDAEFHEPAGAWLESAMNGKEPVGLSNQALLGVIRILTSRRIPGMGWPLGDVLALVEGLLDQPVVRNVSPGPEHWGIFTELCRSVDGNGNVIPDCYLAALALEREATFVSRDRFFGTVPGLTWIDPAA